MFRLRQAFKDIPKSILKACVYRRSSGIISQTVDVNGLNIHYEQAGHGGHTILLLPGAIGSTKTDFAPQLEKMNREKFTIIAWDPPGYGKSRPPKRTWPADFFRRDAKCAVDLMKVLKREKFSIMGWSDGGITGLVMASEYPEHIRYFIEWGGNAFITKEDEEMLGGVADVEKWSPRMREPFTNVYGEEYFRIIWKEWFNAYFRYLRENDGDICVKGLSKIECPTLIVHGQKDAIVAQSHPDFLHKHIKNSKLINIPDGKHNLHFKYADEFHKMIEDFIQ